MNIINHQSNGAKGLRIAATVCVIIGWIALLIGFIGGIAAEDVVFIAPFGLGVVALGVMNLIACAVRALASLAEAAQLFFDINALRQPEDDEV